MTLFNKPCLDLTNLDIFVTLNPPIRNLKPQFSVGQYKTFLWTNMELGDGSGDATNFSWPALKPQQLLEQPGKSGFASMHNMVGPLGCFLNIFGLHRYLHLCRELRSLFCAIDLHAGHKTKDDT